MEIRRGLCVPREVFEKSMTIFQIKKLAEPPKKYSLYQEIKGCSSMIGHYDMIWESSSFELRLEMVGYAGENGIGKTGRHYRTTRVAVRKWTRRYKEEGLNGLCDKPRAPHRIPHNRSKETEGRVIELRKTHPAWSPERIKMHYELPILAKAIGRIIRQARQIRKRKKKR